MASRNYSDTVPASTIVGPGGGVATGLTAGGTAMELSAPISSGISTFPFSLRLEPGTSNEEVVLVTAGAGTSGSPYTITRAQGTTTAKTHATGSAVSHGIYSTDLADVRSHIDTGFGVHQLTALEKVNGSFVAKNTTAVTVANTVTETSLHSATIPANEAALGGCYRLIAFGTFGNVVTAVPTITFRLKYGGTTFCTTIATTNAAVQTNQPWKVESEIVLFSSPGSGALWHANLKLNIALGNATIIPATVIQACTTGTVATGSQVNQTFEVTAQWSAANAANTLTCFSGIIERVY